MKIAIVCEWLVGIGGAERVVLEVHRMFPDAPIYTSQYDPEKIDWFKDADVRTGWLQKLPAGLKKFLPVLRAWYFSHLDLSDYDLVITCNFGAEAKAVKTRKNKATRLSKSLTAQGASEERKGGVHASTVTAHHSSQRSDVSESIGSAESSAAGQADAVRECVHICLCNAPTHYYWSRYDQYMRDPGFPKGFNWLARLGLKILVAPMRRWDYRAAQNPDHMVAISTHIQKEIKKYYDRDSEVIHPPVNIERFAHLKETERHGFVVAGRQTPYKRIDLAVAACTELGLPLTVIGDGPEHEKLKAMAGPTITFTGLATEEEVALQFASAEAFIFPTNVEDFGVTPVEAMAAGTPVIAYKAGGPLDFVVPGKTGEFFTEQTVESLVNTLKVFKPNKYSPRDIKKHASAFSNENFQKNLSQYIKSVIQ